MYMAHISYTIVVVLVFLLLGGRGGAVFILTHRLNDLS